MVILTYMHLVGHKYSLPQITWKILVFSLEWEDYVLLFPLWFKVYILEMAK